MKTKYTNQRFISGLLVILSVTSLAMLLLQFTTPAVGGPRVADFVRSGSTAPDMYALFTSDAFRSGAYGPEYLLVSLSVIALLSLLSFHSSRRPEDSL